MAKKCQKKCTKHLFILKPVHYSAFFSRSSQYSYCPENLKYTPNIPKFNRDKKPYTAAFILPVDQSKLIDNDKIYQTEQQMFKKLNHQEKTEIFIPKPKSKNYYCYVCKETYEDYQEHIFSQKHRQTIKLSLFNHDILNLCSNFQTHQISTSQIILNEDSKTSLQSTATADSLENLKLKTLIFQNDGPDFFSNKLVKQSMEGLDLCKNIKSFHTFCQNADSKAERVYDLNFLQQSMNRELNENCFLPQCTSFKMTEQTASSLKAKFDRPIILAGKLFNLDS